MHTTALVAALCVGGTNAFAEPTGGTVTSGSAGISTSGNTTSILQSTDRAIIRWDTFDINSSEHVQFLQPNSSSITVNRIRDSKASQIDGRLSANGNIILINPNGILFGASSVVDVGGLIATTSDLDDDNAFMNGGAVKFTKPGDPNAKIVNSGTITVRDGGLVGLVAPNVENHGVIQAKLGKVHLASGDIHTIDLAGDGLIKLEVSEHVYAQSVKNTGTIKADGGEILLTAAAARGIVDTLVTNTGTLQANTVTLTDGTQKTGRITVSTYGLNLTVPHDITVTTPDLAVQPPRIINTGTLSVNGDLVDQVAGSITVLGKLIQIGDGSVVTASGDSGGGDIRIGGDYQGGNNVPTSDMVFISEHAILSANARRRGDGGRIILWSDENTRFYGHAESMGGIDGGNGGLIEVSSKKFLDFNGTTDLRGETNGILLLDPTDITISTGANSNVNGASPFAPTADDVVSVLNITTLQAALASGNVIVQTRATGAQAGNITVANALSWTSGNTLTLDAHGGIIVNAAIAANSGSITMIAGADVAFNANITGTGTITIRQANDSMTMGIAGGAGTLNLSAADLTRIVDGWGNIILGRATSTVATTVNARTWNDNLTILSGTGAVNIAGTQTMAANTLTITTANGAVGIGGMAGTTGGLTVSSGGAAISITGAVATGGAVSLTSAGGTISNSATLGSGALTMTSGGGIITLGSAVTATGTTNINSGAGALNINAALSSGTNALTLTTAGSNITTNASGAITGGVINMTTSGGNIVTGSTITASNTTTLNSGAGLINLGGNLNAGANSVSLTTTARTITTLGLTSSGLTINSNGANVSTGAISASGAVSITSGAGTINVGAITSGTNAVTLTSTGFGITTAAITSGALSIASSGGIITTNGAIAAAGITNINSGAAAMNINNALGSGAFAMTLTTTGTAITKNNTGAITSAALTINTSGGNLSIGTAGVAATGTVAVNTGAGTVNVTGTFSSTAATLGITTTNAAITLAGVTSGALNLASGGAAIITGAITATGAVGINAGANTINVGAIAAGTNGVTLTTVGFGITTAAVTSGAFTVGSGGGIINFNGNIAASGITGITSGGAAVNANAAFGAGALTITTAGGAFTKANTGALTASTMTITTTNGNVSIGTGGVTTTGATNINAGTGSIAIGGTWTATGQTIALTTNNNTVNKGNSTSAALTVNTSGGAVTFAGTTTTTGILTINSGAGNVALNAAVNTAANAFNITTTGGEINKAAAITSTGALTWASGGGNIIWGTGALTAATGSTSLNSGGGNITIGGSGIVYTTGGAVTLNSGATGVISINNVITTGTGALAITTDTDMVIGAAISGTGAFSLTQFSAGTTIGIGAGQAGTINISAAEYALIGQTWSGLTIGRIDGTGAINIAATTWGDNLTLRSSTGVISLNGAQNFAGNSFTITTDADIVVGGQLTGTGTLTIAPQTNTTTIGIGTGQTGTISFTDAEKAFLHTTWGSIIIGSVNMTGDINIGATSWLDPLTLRTNTGVININGAQTMAANALTINTNADLNLGGNLSGTGALTISTVASSSTTMGFGDGQVGTLNLTNAELSRIQFGWSGITLGSTTAAGTLNLGAWTWDDVLTVTTAGGNINMGATTMTVTNGLNVTTTTGNVVLANATFGTTGALTITTTSGGVTLNGATMGTGNLTVNTNGNLVVGGNLNGSSSSTLTIQGQANATTMGIGDAQVGTINLTNAELDFIQDGWGSLVFGLTTSTGAVNLGNYTWKDALTVRSGSGLMTVDGATMGANNLTIMTDSAFALNGALSGTGTLTLRSTSNVVSMAIGDGQTGTVQLSSTELANIQSNWNSVIIGHAGLTNTMNIGQMTWGNNITFLSNSGAITVNGAQQMGANNLTFTTNADPTFAAGLAGTGILTIQSTTNSIDMGIGDGQAGNVLLSNADLGNILNGWNQIVFSTTGTGADINLGAYTWQYDTLFRTAPGIITIAGDQQTNKNMTFETNANIAINANLGGSGTLTIRGQAVGTTMTIATTGGNIVVDATELGRIADGWDQIVFGRTDATGTINAGAYSNWNDNVRFATGTGIITVSGAQNFNGNDLTISTNSNLALSNTITSAGGDLIIEGSAANTTINLVAAGGTLNLTAAELNQISDGWNSLTFGNITGTGVISIAAYTWKDNATFITRGNIAVSGVQSSNASTDVTYVSLAGNFVNSAGATPFSGVGAGGRYLIYSTASGSDTYGGFTPPTAINAQTYFSQPPSSIAAGQNRIIYNSGAAKILYLKIDDQTKVYGDTLPTFTYTYLGGLQGGELLSNAITSFSLNAVGASMTDDAGTMTAITGSFSTALGYTTVVTNGTLTVTKAPILITASNTSQTYGDATPTFTINYIGLRNGETSSVIDTLATASSGTSNLTNAGTYNITVSGAIDNNYTFNYAAGTLTINKAVLTATTQNATREFGDANPSMSIVYTGFKNGEDDTVIDSFATASSAAVATTGIGNYTISGSGGLDNNYTFNFVNTGQLTITRATLTATTQNATREYGLANPSMSVVYTGFKNADGVGVVTTPSTVISGATLTSDVGDYAITASGAAASNYQFVYVNSGLLTVTKATVTVTTQNSSREYGDANTGLSASYSGFRNGQTSAVLTSPTLFSSTANNTSAAGTTYAITATGADALNYQFNYVNSGLLTITKATVTGTTQNATREYGDANPALSIVYTGFKNGEDQTVLNVLGTASTTASAVTGIGDYAITGSGGTDDNYNIVYNNAGLLTIARATINVTANNATREYGLANPAMSIASYTGFKNGEDTSVFTSLATAGTTATILSDVGNYNILGTGAAAANYQFNYIAGTLSVTKAMLTATTQNATREYGLANPTLSVVYTGFRNGDDELDLNTQANVTTGATLASNVGTYGISASGASDNNYDFTYVNTGNLDITKAMLTVTTQNNTREYGLANPTLSVAYSGFRNGDDELDLTTQANVTTGATILSNVGTYGISSTGAFDDNYDFTYVNTGNLSITKAMLTATTQNANREYGLANPTLSVVYTGYRNGDDDLDLTTQANVTTGATIFSNVGTYGISATGAFDDNYDFTYVNTGNLSITKAMLTATTQNANREYGLANPTLSVVYTGFRNGDDELDLTTQANVTTGATIFSNVGTYGISATGAFDDNYDFTYANTGNLSITQATLTATTQDNTREYGLANPTLSVIYTGFRNGDDEFDIDTGANVTSAALIGSDVGTYGISASGAADTNYTFIYVNTGNLSVTKAMLTATTQSDSREYGLANPTLSVIYTGFRNGDDDLDINTLANVTTGATLTSNVGTYGISASGAFDNNYDFTYVNTGNLSVTKAMLTATTQNDTREYGLANPTLSVIYTGFRNGDDDLDIDTLANVTTGATLTSNVGTYGISANGAFDNNYDFAYVNTGNLSVTKAMLTATTQSDSREYGLANPTLNVTYTGFRNGDDELDLTTLATASTIADLLSNVGTYAITAAGAFDDNYDFTYANTGNLSVTKAMLTATTQNATREYGLANPAMSIVYTGFRNGDDDLDIDMLGTASSLANLLSNVGTYAITGSGALDNNYDFTYVNTGNLSITKAMLTATTQNATREYGLANPTLNVAYSGFRNGDDAFDLNVWAAPTTGATILSDVGTYGISASGASATNYDFTYVNTGTLSITQATITVDVDDTYREFSNPNPTFSATYSGFRNGETTSVIDLLPTFNTIATNGSPEGTYAITAGGASDNNYSFIYLNGMLTIIADGAPPPVITPPAPPVTTTPPSNNIPSTAERSTSAPDSYYLYNTPFASVYLGDIVSNQTPSIVFIDDDSVFDTSRRGTYLIAITERLRREYYGEEREEQDSDE